MIRSFVYAFLVGLAALPAGCVDAFDVGSESAGLGSVDIYEKQFTWEVPQQCQTFLHRRIYDEDAHVVSYEAERTLTYTIDVDQALPLGVEIDGSTGPVLSVRGSDQLLEIRDARGTLALRVADYTAGEGQVIERTTVPIEPMALSLLACSLPIRTELGYVPGFLRNIRDADAPSGGVASNSSERRPLIHWSSDLSVLGAFARQGMCTHAAADGGVEWRCDCGDIETVAGIVPGYCD